MRAKNSSEALVKELADRVSQLEGIYDYVSRELQGIRNEINALYRSLHALKSELVTSDIQNRSHILEKLDEWKSALSGHMEAIKTELMISDERISTGLSSEVSSLRKEVQELAQEISILRNHISDESRKTIRWVATILLIIALLQGGLILMLL